MERPSGDRQDRDRSAADVESRLRMLATRAEVDADDERAESRRRGGTLIRDLVPRRQATVSGVLRSTILRPRSRVPALEADVYDGSGSLLVVWLGRREIAGIRPGRRIRLTGVITRIDGQPTMFNPRYELAPSGTE